MTTPVYYEEACVPFYREHREAIYKRLQELADESKHLPNEKYRYMRGKNKKFYDVSTDIDFYGSSMAEALLDAADYFRKNCKREGGEVADILQIPIECIYGIYRPGLSTNRQVELILQDFQKPSAVMFYKVS